jgi:hypothetical protein
MLSWNAEQDIWKDSNVKVVGISGDPVAKQKAFSKKHNLTVRIDGYAAQFAIHILVASTRFSAMGRVKPGSHTARVKTCLEKPALPS